MTVRFAALTVFALTLGAAAPAIAGEFDARGVYHPSPNAVASIEFGADFDVMADYFTPAQAPAECKPGSTVVTPADPFSGSEVLHVALKGFGCADRFIVHGLPATKAAYRATLWMRHGGIDAQLTATHRPESAKPTSYAKLSATGRTTSDGWVELASNGFSIDGEALSSLYLKLADFDARGTEVDAFELVQSGDYIEPAVCKGSADPVCGTEAVCQFGRCEAGGLHVPPLPDAAVRDEVVDRMAGLLTIFFGGRKTRLADMPRALERIETLRKAPSAWTFWNGFATAIRELHDWHTHADGDIQSAGSGRSFNACFIGGVGDTSSASWPRHPLYEDVLVSHVGESKVGLHAGDRLLAVDGKHPIEWALGLRGVDWGYWQACDDRVYAEALERLGGLIPEYASTITVLTCSSATKTCELTPKTISVATIDDEGSGYVACDNRPVYYLTANNPGPRHDVGYKFYEGQVVGTTPDEKIRALIWDTLYGGGDPQGFVNTSLKSLYTSFKSNARGVLLDHRAGNGGTLDAAETATTLMCPPSTALVFRSPIDTAGFNGPADNAAGLALFATAKSSSPYRVGSVDYDPLLPVALLLHRDGSASDFFPFGVKGAPKVRIFGPGPTAGAFSTFFTFDPPGPISFQLASGDSISAAGAPLIGHGVEPDEVVLQRQSDLLAGKDSLVESAVAWLRAELKP